jgi:uncharacterized membrane protein
MNKGRMEAFSDGVFAVIITIMVFNIKPPQVPAFTALAAVLPAFLGYALSFLYVGIYWNNHHHLLHAAEHVSGKILWCNLHLLFWLSLAPFATAWIGQSPRDPAPAAFYGGILLFSAIAYFLLVRGLLKDHSKDSALALSIGNDAKGKWSIVIYLVAILLAFVKPWAAYLGYFLVALLWLLPDRRIEKVVHN